MNIRIIFLKSLLQDLFLTIHLILFPLMDIMENCISDFCTLVVGPTRLYFLSFIITLGHRTNIDSRLIDFNKLSRYVTDTHNITNQPQFMNQICIEGFLPPLHSYNVEY